MRAGERARDAAPPCGRPASLSRHVAILDLTAIGQNLSPEQWYGGLLRRLGRQLDPSGDLEEKLDDFWFEHDRMGPLDRWMGALQEIVLPSALTPGPSPNNWERGELRAPLSP